MHKLNKRTLETCEKRRLAVEMLRIASSRHAHGSALRDRDEDGGGEGGSELHFEFAAESLCSAACRASSIVSLCRDLLLMLSSLVLPGGSKERQVMANPTLVSNESLMQRRA